MSDDYLPDRYITSVDVLGTAWNFDLWRNWAGDNNIDLCFSYGNVCFVADEDKLLFLLRFDINV